MGYYEKKMKQIAVPASETYIDGNSTLIPCFGKVLEAGCIRLDSTSIPLRVLSICFFTFAHVLSFSSYFSFCHYFLIRATF